MVFVKRNVREPVKAAEGAALSDPHVGLKKRPAFESRRDG